MYCLHQIWLSWFGLAPTSHFFVISVKQEIQRFSSRLASKREIEQPVFPEREPVFTQSEPDPGPGPSRKQSAEAEVFTDKTIQPKVKLTRFMNTKSPQKNRLINVNIAHFQLQAKYARKYKSKLNVLPIQECLQQSQTLKSSCWKLNLMLCQESHKEKHWIWLPLMAVVSFCYFYCNLLSVSLYVVCWLDLLVHFCLAEHRFYTEEGEAQSVVSDAQMLLDVWGTGDGGQML